MSLGNIIIMITTIIIGILTIIEKSQKIKLKPLSWLFGREETNKNISEIKNIIEKLSEKIDIMSDTELEHYKCQAKLFISGFATDLRIAERCGQNPLEIKSETEFISIVDLCEEYLDKNWNSKVRHDAEYIKKIYDNENLNFNK